MNGDTNARKLSTARTPVLVVMHADGWTEIFGALSVDVHIAHMPAVPIEHQAIGEEWLAHTLPAKFSRVYRSCSPRAADLCRPLFPSSIAAARTDVAILHALNDIGVLR